jgi:cytochrome c551/c552
MPLGQWQNCTHTHNVDVAVGFSYTEVASAQHGSSMENAESAQQSAIESAVLGLY